MKTGRILARTGWMAIAALSTWAVLRFALAPIATDPLAEKDAKLPLLQGRFAAESLGDAAGNFAETLARPLFTQTRRPWVPAPEPAPTPPELMPVAAVEQIQSPPPDLILKGVVAGETIGRALIASREQPRGIWLSQAQSIDGWMISEIRSETVTLKLGSEVLRLHLYVENSTSGGN